MSQSGTFPQNPVTPISASVGPVSMGMSHLNPSHHSPLAPPTPRTPSGARAPANGLHLQMASPLAALQHRQHASMPTPTSNAPGWTPEEIAERHMRGDFRLNAELFARLKETANIHPNASPASMPPTSTSLALHQLQQNEQAVLTAALLQQNLNPGALPNTPGGNPAANAAPNLDPALMLRHIQEEQRMQDHLAAQARVAQQLSSAAAAAHQQPQQQHHQHSHLHLHMHQQLAVAQAAAAQAALGIPPFPALSASSLQNAAASGLNPSAVAAGGPDPAHVAAILGLPPLAGGNAQANPLLSAMAANPNLAGNNPLALGLYQAQATRDRELHAQAAALAGLIPGGAGALSNHQVLAAAAAAAAANNNPSSSRPSLPEDYLSALTNSHSHFNAQMAQEHEMRRLMVLEQERRAAFAMNASNNSAAAGSANTHPHSSATGGPHHGPNTTPISPAAATSAGSHHNL